VNTAPRATALAALGTDALCTDELVQIKQALGA
jgi:hypothetical protein